MQQHNHQTSSHNSLQFEVECETSYGEEVRICGNSMEMGNWNPLLGHRLVTDNALYPVWKSLIPLIIKNANKIQYKACIISNNRVTWQRNVGNRQIQCTHPSTIKFTFNQPDQKITSKLITEISCKQGTLDILQEMQESETSSIQFKSNYPLQSYFMPERRNSLDLSRQFSNSDLSSNLFSPQQWRANSDQFQQYADLDGYEPMKGGTPSPMKMDLRRTQVINRSNDYRTLFSTQQLEQRRSNRSRSRSNQKSQSGSQKNGQQPMSPFIIHVPSVQDKHSKPKQQPTKRSRQERNSCHSNNENNQNQSETKSTSTIMQYDTQNEYLTTRDNDVVIQKTVPSYDV